MVTVPTGRLELMKQYWRNFVCAILGHDMDYDAYIQGSFELTCKRCGHTDRI